MEWLEVSVAVAGEAAEAVAEVLSRYVPQGVAIELGNTPSVDSVIVRAYLSNDDEMEARRQKIAEALWHLGQIWPIPEPEYTLIPDQDWTARWKESIPILHLGQRIVIKPSWRSYTPTDGEVILELDPGMAFGTGLHPTTQLCIEALESLVQPELQLLDLGTGTGILALAAAKLGVQQITAVDNDAAAVTVARRNARSNGVAESIHLIHGSLEDAEGAYDLILANILAPTIISMAEKNLVGYLRPRGRLIASGILQEQAQEVTDVLETYGMTIIEMRQKEDWIAVVAEKATLF
ncbi:MAG: 50S ribosomal protein L11 methyltransferase [Anaerolineae bacterium]|jgi:ribosomal protein L11 methyltransferase|nr:50S ribosomal protein L11 methyltransferase [Anaerolineae bacterium]